MKAVPLKFDVANGYVQTTPEQATHLKIRIPGPSGLIQLPVMIKGTRAGTGNWTWNGDTEKPTLKPSVLTQCGHFAPQSKQDEGCWCKYYKEHPDEIPAFHCYRCHTWINDGKAQFLPDSSHEFVGQTVDLMDV